MTDTVTVSVTATVTDHDDHIASSLLLILPGLNASAVERCISCSSDKHFFKKKRARYYLVGNHTCCKFYAAV